MSVENSKTMGSLIFDPESGRYDIRMGLDTYYGGLHCGECFDVLREDGWIPVRIEMNMNQKWYLVGLQVKELDGLVVRI